MNDQDELWRTVVDRVRAVPAVSSVKRPGAKSTVAASFRSSDPPAQGIVEPVLATVQNSVVDVEINIEVFADVSAAATAIAVGAAIGAVLDEHAVGERRILVRVLSVRS